MKHSRSRSSSTRTVTLLLAAVMSLPLASQVFSSNPGVQMADLVSLYQVDIEALRQKAVSDRAAITAQKRAYTRAVERCLDRRRTEKDLRCPDINDFNSYLKAHPAAPATQQETSEDVDESASNAAPAKKYTTTGLTTEQRLTLRTYTRAGFCSKAAGMMLYNLCLQILGDAAGDSPKGIENDNVKLHTKNSAGPASLKLRLQMLDEAISGSRGRRTDVSQPLRFEGGLND